MIRFYSQLLNDFHIRDNCIRMYDKFVIPNSLHTAINNRLHYCSAAKYIWYPYIQRQRILGILTLTKNRKYGQKLPGVQTHR